MEIQGTGKNSMMAGFYHENYQDSLLMLMRRRGADAGLVVKVNDDFVLRPLDICGKLKNEYQVLKQQKFQGV